MKKLLSLFITALLTLLLAVPASAAVSVSDDVYNALEKRFDGLFSYYDEGSVAVKDLQSFTTNQLDSEGNVTGEIQVDAMYVEYKEERDRFFYYTGHEIQFYDATNGVFVESSSFEVTPDIQAFQDQYKDATGKHFNAGSTVLYMVLLLGTIVVVPVLIILFHNTGRSYITNFYRGATVSK